MTIAMTTGAPDGVTLRRAVSADAAAIAALHVAAWRESYAGIVPRAMLHALSVAARAAMWQTILDAPDRAGCVAVVLAERSGAEPDRRTIGFASCGRQRDPALADAGFAGEVGALYVRRAAQRGGVGRSLLAASARALAAAGHGAASLWVLRANDPARAFYTRLGGVIVGERVEREGDAVLVEYAYGWRDLSLLSRSAAA